MFIFRTVIWPWREVMDAQRRLFKSDARAIAMGSTTAAIQLAFMTAIAWFCFWLPGLWIENVLVQLALSGVVLFIIGALLFPLLAIPVLFVTTLIL